ncbi:M20 family metallo-hydrolase [Spongiivirga citrea]|uniref:M20/M25/M40 family metallo-hydrolase n=1 Tax=Spongiivirga citrea TaxID=1481457 RepID=A0A6M0CEY4_9FLAO|nr:M20 family metallo-hydrolase [Spongiivirga citrea]NER16395.1 M20/M25/M40 family metallo-hydrolase [Spongiivirga citrea]
MQNKDLHTKAIKLLFNLIATESFSSEEDETAKHIGQWLSSFNVSFTRTNNNVWAVNKHFDSSKPTILLNSHHDTVKPNGNYTRDPFKPEIIHGKLYGLGSNDAGGALTSLLSTFVHFYEKEELAYNIVVAATAEEESSGQLGLNSLLEDLPEIDFAIVGEPTLMQLAIAEKGLLVIDCKSTGTPGHAAHIKNENNAIFNAIEDLQWFNSYEFPKTSDVLGKVKMTISQINAGKQHNVVPEACDFVVDVRITDAYTNKEVLAIIQENTNCEVKARSMRLNSSSIPIDHAIVQSGIKLGRTTYGSPTLSDQAVLSCPSLKLGPGDSTRSHSADEFIYVEEIKEGIDLYIKILEGIL